MSTTDVTGHNAGGTPSPQPGDMRMEVIVIPVSDVDRAKEFYGRLGWRLDADVDRVDLRLLQYTPPGSLCSIQFGKDLTPAAPGAFQSMYLVVPDLDAARQDLVGRGVEVSEVFHEGTPGARFSEMSSRVSGHAPEGATYGSFATFTDPDGNGWLLQEVTARLPGR